MAREVHILLFCLQKGVWMANFIARLHNCPSQNGSDECKPGSLVSDKGGEFIYSRSKEPSLASDRIR